MRGHGTGYRIQGAQASRLCCPYATGGTPVLHVRVILAFALLAFALPHSASAISYQDWIAIFPSITGEAAAPSADPDGDSLSNLLEYALDGLDPTARNEPGVTSPFIVLRAADGTYAAPVQAALAAERAAAASVHIALRYKPRAGVEGIAFVPMTNQRDLNHYGWGDSAIVETEADGYRWARAKSDCKKWAECAFMRLRVEMP